MIESGGFWRVTFPQGKREKKLEKRGRGKGGKGTRWPIGFHPAAHAGSGKHLGDPPRLRAGGVGRGPMV